MSKIMLVEDDNNLREIYEARLLAEGYEIVSAKDGEEALALAVKEKPDLIISDVMMPKISGFDMLDILRSTPETKNTKVIMMTALSQAEDKARADKLGADKYLVKSQVTLEDVARVAREVLNGEEAGTAEPAVETAAAPVAPTLPSEPAAAASVVAAPVVPAPEPAAAPEEPASTAGPVAPVADEPATDQSDTTPTDSSAPTLVTDPAPVADAAPAAEPASVISPTVIAPATAPDLTAGAAPTAEASEEPAAAPEPEANAEAPSPVDGAAADDTAAPAETPAVGGLSGEPELGQTTAKEEAAIDAQIDAFVAKVSEPTAGGSAPAPAAVTGEAETAPAAPAETAPAPVADAPAVVVAPEDTADPTKTDKITSGGTKVISPIAKPEDDKPSIHEQAAAEEATAGHTPGTTVEAPAAEPAAAPAPAPAPKDGPDPNSVAL